MRAGTFTRLDLAALDTVWSAVAIGDFFEAVAPAHCEFDSAFVGRGGNYRWTQGATR